MRTLGKFVVEYQAECYSEHDTLEEARAVYDEIEPIGDEFAFLFQDIMEDGCYYEQLGIAIKSAEGELE